MNNDMIIVNIVAAVLIVFVFWWFFGSSPEAFWTDDSQITVRVKDGAYQPSRIQVHAGRAIKILFVREDPTHCAQTLFFPELNVSYALPLNQTVEVTLPPQSPGQINFTCQMAMFKGKIIVV